jgi:hypothetical protein
MRLAHASRGFTSVTLTFKFQKAFGEAMTLPNNPLNLN